MELKNEMKKDIFYISAGMVVVGLLFVIFPETTEKTICYVTAAILAILGLVRLITYFRKDRMDVFTSYDLVIAAVLIVVAVFIFIKPEALAEFIITLIGIAMVADGFLKIQYAIDLLRIKSPRWVILLVLAVIVIIAGMIVMFDPFTSGKVLMMFAGIFLILQGISNAVVVILVANRIKKIRVAMEEVSAEETVNTVDTEEQI